MPFPRFPSKLRYLSAASPLLIGLGFPSLALAQTWTAPMLLSTPAEYAGGAGQLKEPNLAPATGGGFHVVYHVGNTADISYRRITPSTYQLGTYTQVYNGLFTANTNIAQMNDGSVLIGWERWNEAGVGGNGKAEIGVAKLNSAGAVVSPAQTVSATGGFAKFPQISSYGQANDSRALLSYYNTSTTALRSRTSPDATNWGPDNFLQTADIQYRAMGIAKSPVDGSVWRAYGTSNGNNTYNLKMVKFDAGTQTWGAPVTIQSNIISDYYPSRLSLAVSHTGKVMVAWDSAKRWGNSSGVSGQIYTPETSSWSSELQIWNATPFFGNIAAVPGADSSFYVFNTNNSTRDFPLVRTVINGVVDTTGEKPGGVGTYTTADFTPYVRGAIDPTGKVMAAWELWANNGAGGTSNPQLFYSMRDNPLYEAGVWLGGTGNWSDTAKWAGMAIPNNASFTAKLDNGSPAVSNISLDQDATVGSVLLNPADTLNINATRTLTITGAAASTLSGPFNNSGTLAVQANTTALTGGGTHTGAFNVSPGATLEFAGGTHTLNNGTASFAGAGTVKISAGAVNAAGLSASGRTVQLTGGTLNVTGSDFVGNGVNGTFEHSGGTHTTATLSVGKGSGATGTYLLSGTGQLNTTTTVLGDGSGTGNFTQTSGSHTVTGSLIIGTSPAAVGVGNYTLSGGSLSAGNVSINWGSSFTYNSGTFTTGNLSVFGSSLNIGANSISPTGTFTVGANAIVDSSGGVVTAGSYAMQRGFVHASLAGPASLTKTTGSTLTLTRANSYAGGTIVNAGTLVAADGGAFGTGSLTVANGATAQAQADLPSALTVAAFSTTGTGRLDLTNNDMVVRSSTLAAVRASIAQGFNGGTWSGAGGITSSTAATHPSALTALGFASNADLNLATFSGVAGLDANDVLVKYTYYGDADLTGVVDLDDFGLFLDGYQDPGTFAQTWLYGDFDYTGVIDLDDFGLFLYGYQNQGGPLSALSDAVADASGVSSRDRALMQAAIAAVPEPSGLVLLATGFGVLRRRRRPISPH